MKHPLHEHIGKVHHAHRRAYADATQQAELAAAELEQERRAADLIDHEAGDIAAQKGNPNG